MTHFTPLPLVTHPLNTDDARETAEERERRRKGGRERQMRKGEVEKKEKETYRWTWQRNPF